MEHGKNAYSARARGQLVMDHKENNAMTRHKHTSRPRRYAAFALALFLGCAAFPALARDIPLTPSGGLDQLTRLAPTLRPGDTVTFQPGVYKGAATINGLHGSPGQPIVITAEKGAVIESWKDADRKSPLPASSLLIQASNDIEIRNLDISGASRGITIGNCTNTTISNNHIHDISNYGIMNYMSSNTSITDNIIERSTLEHGIYISGDASNIHIFGNTIRDTHINGIHCNGKIASPLVENNTLERIGSYPTKEGGAAITFVGGVTSPIARGNVFKAIHGQGITIDAPNALIDSNTFQSYAWSAILALPNATNMTLANNRFQDATVIPLQIEGNILASLKASGNFYASRQIAQDAAAKKTITQDQWRALGKDAK